MPNPASSAAGSSRRQDRLLEILGVINDSGGLSVADLALKMGASPATIRRDIAALAEHELVERTRGGVRSTARGEHVPLELRSTLRGSQKRAIAEEAAAQVPSGPCAIGLAGGSTVTEVLRCLEHRSDLTIVTNSVTIALEAAERSRSRVLLAGGALEPQSLELVGSLTEAMLKLLHVRIAVVGCDGISAEGGVTGNDDVAARTGHMLMSRADQVMVVADGSKVGRTALARSAEISKVGILVTDASADRDEVIRLSQAGVRVLVVGGDETSEHDSIDT